MKPVPQDKIREILIPIAQNFQKETNTEERADLEFAATQVEDGYEMRSISAFVDNLESPKSCLILKTGRSWLSPAPSVIVLLFWVKPDERKNSHQLTPDMFKTIEAFARLNECERIFGSSWVYLGTTDISALWSHAGFDLQEKVFVKTL